jgi:hypothetical protein
VGKVCRRCTKKLEQAEAIVAREEERLAVEKEGGNVHTISTVWHDFDGYYTRGTKGHRTGLSRATQDALRRARHALYIVASQSTLNSELAPGWRNRLREFPPGVFEALEHYDAEVREAMVEFAKAAYRDGSDALRRLASGAMTLDDFEEGRE